MKDIYHPTLERYVSWSLIAFFCLVPLVRLAMVSDWPVVISSPGDVMSFIAKASALVGLVLYAINFVLAARLRIIETIFGGLNRAYIAHHITGGLALIILILHPALLAVQRISSDELSTFLDAALYLLPRTINAETESSLRFGLSMNAGIIAFYGMVLLLILTFFIKLPYQIWLLTHKFLGVAFLLAGIHVVLINSRTSNDVFLRSYILVWVIIGLTAFIYKTLLGNVVLRRADYVVRQVKHMHAVTDILLDPLRRPLSFKPGQFIFARFLTPKGHEVSREYHPFTIASSPKEKSIRLIAKSLGDYTSQLKHITPGTVVSLEGAYGKFSYTRFGNSPQIWIAGGIGITPFLSMAKSLEKSEVPIDLIYSVAHRSELIDESFLDETLPGKIKSFRFFPYIANEKSGLLNASKVASLCGGLEDKHIFICGPAPMMKDLTVQLRRLGVPKNRIHTEEFSMS